MLLSYNHKLISSFYLWIDNCLSEHLSGFKNINSGQLYYQPNCGFYNKIAYASDYKQWIYESISGVNLPNGVFGSTNISTGQSGCFVDYENGRFLFDTGVGTGLDLKANFAVKEINLYYANQTEYGILFEEKLILNDRFDRPPKSGIQPYIYALPALFILPPKQENTPFELGGTFDSKSNFRIMGISNNDFNLESIASYLTDKTYKCLPIFNSNNIIPFNEYGDLKSGAFSYSSFVQENSYQLGYIEKVKKSYITNTLNEKFNKQIKVILIDFYISHPRI